MTEQQTSNTPRHLFVTTRDHPRAQLVIQALGKIAAERGLFESLDLLLLQEKPTEQILQGRDPNRTVALFDLESSRHFSPIALQLDKRPRIIPEWCATWFQWGVGAGQGVMASGAPEECAKFLLKIFVIRRHRKGLYVLPWGQTVSNLHAQAEPKKKDKSYFGEWGGLYSGYA